MSWHYSLALVEEYSEASCLDGELSVPWKSNPTHEVYCSNAKMTESLILSLCGMTLEPLMESPGEGKSISSQVGSHVQMSQYAGETPKGSKENPVGCGQSRGESFAKYDQYSHTWRTAQLSLFGGLTEFLENWPRWGIMQNGECWDRAIQVEIAGVSESGLLPTPIATDWKGGTTAVRKDRGTVRTDQWRDYVKIKYGMTYPHPMHSELRMGWPIGWSDLKPLEMDRFQSWQQKHGKS